MSLVVAQARREFKQRGTTRVQKQQRKFWLWLGVFFAVTAAVVGVCLLCNRAVRTAPVDRPVPADAAQHSYVLTGWKEAGGRFQLDMTGDNAQTEFELVFSEMNSFAVRCNGQEVYRYDAAQGYERVHVVSLPRPQDGQPLEIEVECSVFLPRSRVLLASAAVSKSLYQTSYGANMVTIGAFLLTAFYSLSLYVQKRSETYLPLIAALSAVALVSALSNSTLSLPGIQNIGEPVRFFRVTFCAALCPILLRVRLKGRWNLLYSWPGILSVTVLLYVLYRVGLSDLSNEISYLLIVPAALACADGMARREPFARTFSAFVAVREALRIYYRLIQAGATVCPAPFFYYYMPQLSSFLFVLGCIVLINGRFAATFRRVDILAARLEEANAHLDAKVAERTEALQQANAKLVEEQQRKHSIMLNIFHDLRSPIFAAMGSADRVRPADNASQKNLTVLRERLDFVGHLSEELFYLAKLEEGQITFEHFRIRLDDFCPPIAAGFETLCEQKGLRFSFSLEPGLLATGDAYRLKQALENLLFNAVKYTDSGEVDFSVQKEGQMAALSVRDTGPGIAPDDLPHVFDRYYQGHLARGPQSAGLGLSIARAIALAHGGDIRVQSQMGHGTCFTLTIPLEQEEEKL